ncbi:MAG TPA: helical backbone metal receptor, partial [bacterium]|nr:helical backbone metal receptor [bacterium]
MKIKEGVLITFVIIASLSSQNLFSNDEMPKRIVSLKPVITDTLIAIGAGDMIVGATKYCELEALENRPQIVGDYTRPMIEKIVALRPDVVLNSEENSSRRSFEKMESLGIKTSFFSFSTPDEIVSSISAIGATIGMKKSADAVALQIKKEFIELKKRWSSAPQKKGFIIWGRRPIIAAGDISYMGTLLSSIGVENAAKKSSVPYPRIGVEDILTANPDFIVDLSMGSEAHTPEEAWSKIKNCDAYKRGRIYIMNADDFRPGPRLPDAL